MTTQELVDIKVNQQIHTLVVMIDEGWDKDKALEFVRKNTTLHGANWQRVVKAVEASK